MKTRPVPVSPIKLPELSRGVFRIEREILLNDRTMPVVTFRDSLFRGEPVLNTVLKKGTVIHRLKDDEGTWMSDVPCELFDMYRAVEDFSGDVLVGGLGLGIAAAFLLKNSRVKRIVVVEKSEDVIALVQPHLPKVPKNKSLTVMAGDLFDVLRNFQKNSIRFHYAFYDIWRPIGETVMEEFVRPLRKLSEGLITQENIRCWGEKTMQGQTQFALLSAVQLWKNAPADLDRIEGIFRLFDEGNVIGRVYGPEWTFFHWMYKTRPSQYLALSKISDYIHALVCPAEWDILWKEYEFEQRTLGS